MKFSEKLIELRKTKGLSQEKLGNIINVSRQAISKWESEQANPEIDKVKEISKYFNVSIDYLLNDDIVDLKKQTTKFNKKKIKKIILRIILICLMLYLIITIYKFTILLIFSIKANNIADYDSYSILIDHYNDFRNEPVSSFEEITYDNNIEVIEDYGEDVNNPTSITYIDSKNRKAYSLNYDDTIKKYVYDNLEIVNADDIEALYTLTTIRDTTKEHIPSSIGEILLSAINPKISVSFNGDYLRIIYKISKNTYHEVSINKITGILNEIKSFYNDNLISNASYDYIFDDDRFDNSYLIDELFLKDIEYVQSEDLYE